MDIDVRADVREAPSRFQGQHVELVLTNDASKDVLIDPYNLCPQGRLKAPVFKIMDSQGKRVRYVGRLYKRGGPDFKKFHKLKAGKQIRQICDVGDAYDFSSTTPPYRVSYSVLNMHPDVTYFEITSKPNDVRF